MVTIAHLVSSCLGLKKGSKSGIVQNVARFKPRVDILLLKDKGQQLLIVDMYIGSIYIMCIAVLLLNLLYKVEKPSVRPSVLFWPSGSRP